MVEGSSGVKLPTTWTNRKVEVGRVREEKGRRKKIRKEKEPEEKKMQARENGRKVAEHCFSNVLWPQRVEK